MHDFKLWPELTNAQMELHYFESPHKQIVENFMATVIKVHDGDTITLQWEERTFNFPLRIINIDAPELNVKGGAEAKSHLQELIENEEVEIIIDPNQRTEKWGRVLGDVLSKGLKMSEEMINSGHALPFERRREAQIPNINKELNTKKWFS